MWPRVFITEALACLGRCSRRYNQNCWHQVKAEIICADVVNGSVFNNNCEPMNQNTLVII